jgi:hypothetical protein
MVSHKKLAFFDASMICHVKIAFCYHAVLNVSKLSSLVARCHVGTFPRRMLEKLSTCLSSTKGQKH